MPRYKYLIIHCTATKEGFEVTPEMIKEWHMGKNGRGWSRVGYSDLITLDGKLHNLHFADNANPFDDELENGEMTWGVRGINKESKHICYVGGLDSKNKAKNTLNESQAASLNIYVHHEILRHPDVLIAGHNQFSPKDCPSFFVPDLLGDCFDIPGKNLFKQNPYNQSGY